MDEDHLHISRSLQYGAAGTPCVVFPGYQPLMRHALNRFARFELREMAETLQKVESARARIGRGKHA